MDSNGLSKCLLKMSYGGLTCCINCDFGSTYEDILRVALNRFDLPRVNLRAVRVSNGFDYIFHKQTFEYYLQLFPQPKITFYLRVNNCAIVQRTLTPYNPIPSSSTAFRLSKLGNKRQHSKIDESDDDSYEVALVHRQNCFLGALPASNLAINRRPELDGSVQHSKRFRFNSSPYEKKSKNAKSFSKGARRIRF